MAGKDDDLTDLASDLAKDPELADTFAKLEGGPREGSPGEAPAKSPLEGIFDDLNLEPAIPEGRISDTDLSSQIADQPISAPVTPAGPPRRRASGALPLRGLRAFAQPIPQSTRAAAAQPEPAPAARKSAIPPLPAPAARISAPPPLPAPAARISSNPPSSSPSPASPAPSRRESRPSSIPGVVRLYAERERDTPTTRFVKPSPDALPEPLASDLAALAEAHSSEMIASEDALTDRSGFEDASSPFLLASLPAEQERKRDSSTLPTGQSYSKQLAEPAPVTAPGEVISEQGLFADAGAPLSNEVEGPVSDTSPSAVAAPPSPVVPLASEAPAEEPPPPSEPAEERQAQMPAPIEPAPEPQDESTGPRVWLLAVAGLAAALGTLLALIVVGPLKPSPAAPNGSASAMVTSAPSPTPASTPAITAVEPQPLPAASETAPAAPAASSGAVPADAPTETTPSALSPTQEPSAVAAAPTGVPRPVGSPTAHIARAMSSTKPSVPPAQPSSKPTAKPTTKPSGGPIFELEN